MFGLITDSKNTLVQFTAKKSKKGFIYIDSAGNYLPTAFEERTGLPINEKEWKYLEPKARNTFHALDAATIEQVTKAVEKRKELLRIRDLEERKKWVAANAPMKMAA